MNKEILKYYMELFEDLLTIYEGLDGGMTMNEYNAYCTVILEKLFNAYNGSECDNEICKGA